MFGVYEDGMREGVHVGWSYSGEKQYELEYVDGEPSGVLTTLFAGGEKASEGALENGLAVGTHKVWSDSGELMAEVKYGGSPTGVDGAWRFWRAPIQTSADSPR